MTSLQLTTRIQYTFCTTQEKYANLLTLNVKAGVNPHAVNVVATLVVKISKNRSLIKIVVGTDDPNNSARGGGGDPLNPDPQRTNELQNEQFRINMRCVGIRWKESGIIQIFNVEAVTGTPGIFRIYVAALTCAKIPIVSFQIGERVLLYPLQTCTCEEGKVTKFADEVLSAMIEVSKRDLFHAVQVLSTLKFPSGVELFDESQLCINRFTVARKYRSCRNASSNVLRSKKNSIQGKRSHGEYI